MAEDLFWSVLNHFEMLQPGFGGVKFRRLPRRFKRTVHVLDSTTIMLFANCMDWAKQLLRFLHACSDWNYSFTRLFTCLRAVLWQRRHLLDYLQSYGTAGGTFRMQWPPQQAFLPGFG